MEGPVHIINVPHKPITYECDLVPSVFPQGRSRNDFVSAGFRSDHVPLLATQRAAPLVNRVCRRARSALNPRRPLRGPFICVSVGAPACHELTVSREVVQVPAVSARAQPFRPSATVLYTGADASTASAIARGLFGGSPRTNDARAVSAASAVIAAGANAVS